MYEDNNKECPIPEHYFFCDIHTFVTDPSIVASFVGQNKVKCDFTYKISCTETPTMPES